VTRAIVLKEYGGPEQLTLETIAVGEPGPGEVRVRHTAIGVNFIDTYFRRGLYPIKLPAIIGDQAVGIIEAVGPEVADFKPGDRIAYGSHGPSYVEARVMPARHIVHLPVGLGEDVVAASLTRGMTAEYLLFRLHALTANETVVVHAAAGGTGLIVCQWARHLGATVIATVGAESKVEVARAAGAHHVLVHSRPDFVARVRELTAGRGVDVVYDSIGRDTFQHSLECLRPRGLMVAYGNASGKPDPLDVLALARHGSLFLTRPNLGHYVSTRAEFELASGRYFDALHSGIVKPHAAQRFALADAPAAHRHLEDREQLTIPILVP